MDVKRTTTALVTIALISNLPHCLFSTAIGIPPLTYVTCAAQICALIAIVLAPLKAERLLGRATFTVGLCLCLAGSIIALQLFPNHSAVYGAAVMIGLGEMLLWLYQGMILTSLNERELTVATFGGMELAFFLAAVILTLPFTLSVIVQVVFVGVSCALLLKQTTWETSKHSPPPQAYPARRLPLPASLVLITGLFSFGMNYLRTGVGENGDWVSTFALAAIISGIVIVLELLLLRRSLFSLVDVSVVLMLSVPILFFGAGFDHDPLLLSLAAIGFFLIVPRYYQWIIGYAREERMNPFRGIACMYLVNAVCQILGAFACSYSEQLPSFSARFTIAVLIAVGIILCAFIPYSDRTRNRIINLLEVDDSSEPKSIVQANAGTNRPVASLDALAPDASRSDVPFLETLGDMCEAMARDFSLTKREREVLALLARRKTIASIAEELCLSTNTIKSHVLHIHQKLDVHSHEELFSLIESYGLGSETAVSER